MGLIILTILTTAKVIKDYEEKKYPVKQVKISPHRQNIHPMTKKNRHTRKNFATHQK
jgi:hypothetical protein